MEWISVEDRLPIELDCEYICYCQHDNDGSLVTCLLFTNYGWFDEYSDIKWSNHVTHWMPLPEPPKEC